MKKTTFAIVAVFIIMNVSAQSSIDTTHSPNPDTTLTKRASVPIEDANALVQLKFILDKEKKGSKYIVFSGNIQFCWSAWQNPQGTTVNGYTDASGKPLPKGSDMNIGIRRFRFGMEYQFSPHVSSYFQVGFNNLFAVQDVRPVPVLLDAIIEYHFSRVFNIAVGQSLGGNFSRAAINSSANSILDHRSMTLGPVSYEDLLLRHHGITIRGYIKNFGYHAGIAIPAISNALTTTSASPIGAASRPALPISSFTSKSPTAFAYAPGTLHQSAYINYYFFDKDQDNVAPFLNDNHLGKKKMLTIGAGVEYQPRGFAGGTGSKGADSVRYYDRFNWSVDFFCDLPINKKENTVLVVYSVYYNYNMGKNFLQATDVFGTPTTGYYTSKGSSLYTGNQIPTIGTGSTWATQAGYLLPRSWFFKGMGQIQLVGEYDYLNFESINGAFNIYNIGASWILGNSNKMKLLALYTTLPRFDAITRKHTTTDGQFLLQFSYGF